MSLHIGQTSSTSDTKYDNNQLSILRQENNRLLKYQKALRNYKFSKCGKMKLTIKHRYPTQNPPF